MKKKALATVSIYTLLFTAVVGFLFANLVSAQTSEVIFINADGSVDPATAPISTFDKVTYIFTDDVYAEIVVERDSIVIDGNESALQGNGNGRGIALSGRTNVTVRNTQIRNFTAGIFLDSSSNISINGNNITNNTYGVWFGSSSNNNISGNNITTNNVDGVRLAASSDNIICDNNITANNWDGVWLDSSSNNNVSGNNIANNSFGVNLFSSSNNNFYHNNFCSSHQQVYDFSWNNREFSPSINVWDDGYPSGGNYWSDYKGIDADGDAIGDTPYVVDSRNTDHYPLMFAHNISQSPTSTPTPAPTPELTPTPTPTPTLTPFPSSSPNTSPAPSPTASPSPEPSQEPTLVQETQSSEPFPTTMVIASVVAVPVIGGGLLLYFKKRKS